MLAIVTVLVWVAALFIPSGSYQVDADGSPIPGTYERTPSPLSTADTLRQLALAPVNGVYGLRNPESGFIDTETLGRMAGQIGVITFIMAIGAFISVSFATKALEVAVAALAILEEAVRVPQERERLADQRRAEPSGRRGHGGRAQPRPLRFRRPRNSARAIVTGWLTTVAIRPVVEPGSRATPS